MPLFGGAAHAKFHLQIGYRSDRSQKLDYAILGSIHFGLGFVDLFDDQLGFGHREPHKIMDAHVAWYFISLLCVFRSKLAHFCPIVNEATVL